MTIQQRILKDIAGAIARAHKNKKWPSGITLPEPDVATLSGVQGADFSSTIALQCGSALGLSGLQVAEDIKSELRDAYAQVQIAQPGFLYFTLSQEQWSQAIDDIERAGEKYGTDSKKKEHILIECVSTSGTQPLMLAQARDMYVADVLARIFRAQGYIVTSECVVHDRGKSVEILGESVMRRYVQSQGMNVPYSDDLYQGAYVSDLARTMDLSVVKKTPLNKMEEAKRYVKIEAIKTIQKQMQEFLVSVMNVPYDSWISEEELLKRGHEEKIEKKLASRDALYESGKTRWVRTSTYGDDKDREYNRDSEDVVSAYTEIYLAYDRAVERKVHRSISFVSVEKQSYEKRLNAFAQILGTKMISEYVPTQLVTFMQGGYDMRIVGRNGDGITLKEYIDEVGKDAARFFCIHSSYDEHARIDLDVMKEVSDRNPLHVLRTGYINLTDLLARAEKEVHVESELETSAQEKVLTHVVSRFPSVIEQCARTLAVYPLTQYGLELVRAVDELVKLCAQRPPIHARQIKILHTAHITFDRLFEVLGIEK